VPSRVIISLLLLKLSVFSGNSFSFGLYYNSALTIFSSLKAENFNISSSRVSSVCMPTMANLFFSLVDIRRHRLNIKVCICSCLR
jgi:hypothetical protein